MNVHIRNLKMLAEVNTAHMAVGLKTACTAPRTAYAEGNRPTNSAPKAANYVSDVTIVSAQCLGIA